LDKIVRKHLRQTLNKGSKREYYEEVYDIFTKEEAESRKIDFTDWRIALKGDWGLTDDNYVAKCLNRRKYKSRYNLVYAFGQAFTSKTSKGKLEYTPHKMSGSYSMVSSKPAWMTKKGKDVYKRFVRIYVAMSLEGKIDHYKLGKVLGESEKIPAAKAKSLLKKEWIQKMIDEQIKKELTKKGIDEGTVIDMVKEAFDVAKDKNDPSNMLRAGENFINILGMKASMKQSGVDEMQLEGVSLESIQDALDPSKEVSDVKQLKEEGESGNDFLIKS